MVERSLFWLIGIQQVVDADSLDDHHPLSIAWLHQSQPAGSVGAGDELGSRDYAYLKAYLVEIVDIIINNAVLGHCIA